MHSNGNSFADGNSMDLGSEVRDGSRPASAAWMFRVLVFRL